MLEKGYCAQNVVKQRDEQLIAPHHLQVDTKLVLKLETAVKEQDQVDYRLSLIWKVSMCTECRKLVGIDKKGPIGIDVTSFGLGMYKTHSIFETIDK